MIQNIYSVKDVKTTFAAPFVDYSDESAMRGMHFALRNQNTLFSFASEDFRLYKIGTFDTITGNITSCIPEFICDGVTIAGLAPQDLQSDDKIEVGNYEK